MHIRIALAHVYPCTKFGGPRSMGVLVRGHKAEKTKLPIGNFVCQWNKIANNCLRKQNCPILTLRGWFAEWHTTQTKALLTWKFRLAATSRLGCSPDSIFPRGHAAARGTCLVARSATWPPPSSFRRSGASNEPSLVRIGPAVPALFTKPLRPLTPTHTRSYFLRAQFLAHEANRVLLGSEDDSGPSEQNF